MNAKEEDLDLYNTYRPRGRRISQRNRLRTGRSIPEDKAVATPEAVATKVVLARGARSTVIAHQSLLDFGPQDLVPVRLNEKWIELDARGISHAVFFLGHGVGVMGRGLVVYPQGSFLPSLQWGVTAVDDPDKIDLSALESYESRLRRLQEDQAKYHREKAIQEAGENRQLMSVVMDSNWLGADVLSCLQRAQTGLTATELEDATKQSADLIAAVLTQLVRFGAVELVKPTTFGCSERGRTIVSALLRMISEEPDGITEGSSP